MSATGRTGSVSTLQIEGEMSIYQAADLKPTLAAALAEPGPLEIDLSGVAELDTAGVQLLLATRQEALEQGREFRVTAHSAAVLDVLEMLNLGTYFDAPAVVSPAASSH
jgi:anti-anti-sigma factor